MRSTALFLTFVILSAAIQVMTAAPRQMMILDVSLDPKSPDDSVRIVYAGIIVPNGPRTPRATLKIGSSLHGYRLLAIDRVPATAGDRKKGPAAGIFVTRVVFKEEVTGKRVEFTSHGSGRFQRVKGI